MIVEWKQEVCINKKLIYEITRYNEVGETRSHRVRCSKCFNMFTAHTQFSLMGWVRTDNNHIACLG